MTKRLIAAVLAFSVAALPAFATAQGGQEVPAIAPRVLMPVDFNPQNDPETILNLDLSNGKRVTIRLMPSWAPNHVERVKTLARQGFYDGVIFHRVIEGFMAQTGDPTGTGQGGSVFPDLKQEFNIMPHVRGTVSMARAQGEDSANSQFFIVFYPRLGLDRKYTNFGRVIAGMDAVDAIQRGEPPANPTKILQASIGADNKPPPKIEAPAVAPAITLDMLKASAGEGEPAAPAAPQGEGE